ncbi:MAG: hypothetical protein LBG75_00635 [Candidatus Nomurabacteria bacterium]|jgi:hypothetical protein|nr:hypothetical protein [Candidatus Nomurabacteria bacterium]
MVCVAAFIVLLALSLPVVVLSAIGRFKPKVAKFTKPYFGMFKKAWYCVGRRVTLRKCDSNFKDDIKNSVLRKVVLKKPKLVKPVSVGIEVVAFLIVVVAVWSILTLIKSGTALYVYGTCDVSNPKGCVVGESQFCAVGEETDKNFFESIGTWFTEWGTLAADIPARVKQWEARDYVPETADYYGRFDSNKPVALDIFDPGCFVCRDSYIQQKRQGFFDKYNVALVPYPITSGHDGYRFKNSYLISRYIVATHFVPLTDSTYPAGWQVVDKIFTGYNDKNQNWQDVFNNDENYNGAKVEQVLRGWFLEFGYTKEQVKEIGDLANSNQVRKVITDDKRLVEDDIRVKMIPTMLYDGQRHSGLWKG